jgi:hypothetical protein
MGGGLLQLVAYGAQDVYLTGNPQITFFKVVYRRHTNFAIESIEQTLNGTEAYSNSINCTISRNGDLVNRVYVEIDLPGLDYAADQAKDLYVNFVGLKLLKNVTIEIGGQQVDKHYSDWMYIWNELSLPVGKRYGYDKMVGADGMELSKVLSTKVTKLYIPLEFWFCRNVGLALPLIALQYHEVKIKIDFADKNEVALKYHAPVPSGTAITADAYATLSEAEKTLANVDPTTELTRTEVPSAPSSTEATPGSFKTKIWVDYIYLDTDERRKFAQLSHEYLIEQLQFTGEESYSNQIRLNFNHPVKELVWVSKWPGSWDASENNPVGNWNNYTLTDGAIDGDNPYVNAHIKLNGNDRLAPREATYFEKVQPFQHHSNIPKSGGINLYSFALKPEEHQPSGTLNMSRIDTAVLSSRITNTTRQGGVVLIYAVSYNVLRILSGMGGLAYSN